MISSSNIVDGLSWWQSWICVWLGYSIAACFVCMTGRIGATYHISFPVVNRASFGIWGALWPVFNRAAMACIWYGVQAWIGGTCVYLMIRSIWNNWRDVCLYFRYPKYSLTIYRLISQTLVQVVSRMVFPVRELILLPLSPSSSSGWDLFHSSGPQFTRFDICSPSRRTLYLPLVSLSSSGLSCEPRVSVPLSTSQEQRRDLNSPG